MVIDHWPYGLMISVLFINIKRVLKQFFVNCFLLKIRIIYPNNVGFTKWFNHYSSIITKKKPDQNLFSNLPDFEAGFQNVKRRGKKKIKKNYLSSLHVIQFSGWTATGLSRCALTWPKFVGCFVPGNIFFLQFDTDSMFYLAICQFMLKFCAQVMA